MPDLAVLLRLERAVWDALVSGDARADADLLADDLVGVYPTGFDDRAGHAGQLAAGPTVAEYDLADARLVPVAHDAAIVAYRARYRRPGADEHEEMFVSSLWCRRGDRWVNAFSQDTPVGGRVV